MNVALIDADLLDNGTRHPNLALLKLSGWHKSQGDNVRLILNYDELEPDLFRNGADQYEHIAVSKVFTKTKIPKTLQNLIDNGKATCGGTGFFETDGPRLPDEIEHHMPDYHLYDEYIAYHPQGRWDDYKNASIGFTTRGCFRRCPFCVNRNYKKVERHSKVAEFLDPSRPLIYLWDDNFLAANEHVFNEVMDELQATNKRFQFRQGLDVRLMTPKKAARLATSKYHGDYIFAFDHIDAPTEKATMKGLHTWREHSSKNTKVYVLCGYESQDEQDIFSIFKRIELLSSVNCVPYITRHENYNKSPFRKLIIQIARWCNQQAIFKKKTFMQFCEMPNNDSALKAVKPFIQQFPAFSEKYFNRNYFQN